MSETTDASFENLDSSAIYKLRADIVEHAFNRGIIELLGAPGQRICAKDEACRKVQDSPDSNQNLFADLRLLKQLDGGEKTELFKDDLDNLKEKFRRNDIPLKLRIAGIDEKHERVNVSREGHTYQIVQRDGMTTIDVPNSNARSRMLQPDRATTELESAIENAHIDDVNGSAINDCYFLATADAVLATRPYLIKQAVKPAGHFHYKVTFPGDAQHPVLISPPTKAELDWFNSGDQPTWIDIFEKAHRLHADKSLFDQGGIQQVAMQLLTGERSKTVFLATLLQGHTRAQAEDKLAEALNQAKVDHLPVVFASPVNRERSIADGVVAQHSYAMIDYDPKTRNLTLRNPQGIYSLAVEKYPTKGHGSFTIPVSAMFKDFNFYNTLQDHPKASHSKKH